MITFDDVNREFYIRAYKLDNEATYRLNNAGIKNINKTYITRAHEHNAIDIAGEYILKNRGSAKGYLRIFDLFKNSEDPDKVKDLTLESQYIVFYEKYATLFPSNFNDNVYKHSKKLMKDWVS